MKKDSSLPHPLGATLFKNGVNIAIFSKNAQRIEVCFYEKNGKNLIGQYALTQKSNDIHFDFFEGEFDGVLYGLRVYGENSHDKANRFNHNKLLIDPYALELNEKIELHHSMFDNEFDSSEFVPKARIIAPKAIKKANPIASKLDDLIIYELNVRGFSISNKDIPSEIRGTFAGLGHENSIRYLKELGITAIELMPCASWIDERHLGELGLSNYWGYNPIGFMAPDPRLAPNGWSEVRECVQNLESAGIKTIIDVVFNHSGESDKFGPIVSLRGIDNQSYYRLRGDETSEYINDAGTGNILDAESPQVIQLIIDSIKTWHNYGGVHGFRFDLATVLGRTKYGFDANGSLLSAIKDDSELSGLILIAEPWDVGPGGYQLGSFADNWPEWNDKYRQTMRQFWLGDGISLGQFATRFCGSEDFFGGKQAIKSLNYVTAHDGFTLRDLVSYNSKNNYANGEENRDGSDNNNSFNHGIEGHTEDNAVNSERGKSQRALLATLLLSRGIPMIQMGSELGKSQNGNNNAYAQDNEISYIDWNDFDKELLAFAKRVIAIRQAHPSLFSEKFLTGQANDFQSYPDVEWLTPDLSSLSEFDWNDTHKNGLCVILTNDEVAKDRVAIFINPSNNDIEFQVPKSRDNTIWKNVLDTFQSRIEEEREIKENRLIVKARSIVMNVEEISEKAQIMDAEESLVTRLAEALGIESNWTDVNGKVTIVPLSTKIKLIESMGYKCQTDCQVLASIKDFSDKYFRRPIEFAKCFSEGEELKLRLFNNVEPESQINVEDENQKAFKVRAEAIEHIKIKDPDGRISEYSIVKLANLDIGRYKLWLDGFENVICRLTIAPKAGYLPSILETKTLTGLSSQIYALKRPMDQGIGDFTSLGHVMEHCSVNGLDILGINPLHALFPANKDLASPYYPSDRIALEPHYIDLAQIMDEIDFSLFANRKSVDYQKMWQFKSDLLEAHYLKNTDKINKDSDFIQFKNQIEPPIRQFALFQAISEKFPNTPWREWPEALAKRDSAALDKFASENSERINYHLYLQYLCDLQLAMASKAGEKMQIGICRDLAIGTSPDGAESWAIQSKVAKNVSIGAPPDLLGPRGQVWGLPPLIPHLMIESGFKSAIGLYKANMKHAGALRIDHAMGIMRQFWVPEGSSAADGAYVRFPFANILGELKLESVRARCIIIGEDLGTVPEGFSETMNAVNALSYKVLQFEKNGDAFKAPDEYPKACFACISTHDLAPVKGWWDGVDIQERKELGLYTDDEAEKCVADRLIEKRELLGSLKENGLIGKAVELEENLSIEMIAAIHNYIALSRSYLAIAQIEDLAGETIPINLPGTDKERPNWRNCVSLTIDEIFSKNNPNSLSNAIIAALKQRKSLN